MDIDTILDVLSSKEYNSSLPHVLNYIVNHIRYCKYYNINMYQDPILSKVLIFR